MPDTEMMEASAEEAREKLKSLPDQSIKDVASWIKEHYLSAGYKRLCRVLFEEAGLK